MTIIENDYLKVAISNKGAQLASLFNKATQTEHMWQADPQVWPWHAPNLFPVVGGLINNELLVNGDKYPLSRHGFARQSEFVLKDAGQQSAVFSLQYSTDTLKAYPYKFDFHVMYDLIDNALRVTYKVLNLDNKPIYFSVGGHPAFNVPFNGDGAYEDYYLEFENSTGQLETHLLSAEGYFNGQTQPVELQGNRLPLTKNLFNNDALVFKNIQSRAVSIKSAKHAQTLTIEFPHFDYLGIWAKPGADFVCIEPWLGCADTENKAVDIQFKEAIQKLDAGHVFEAPYFISI
ncbi:aldose 1-epimerase family protein [Mucilaginibacter sp. Bleaf8]|uniref:aldose 1-epimerase family protein n=1 Tax=Mucilaginibacter sp. Bleaf8 TaxID=2834430 RepID=UPI001BCDB9A1|nr:aldose 1-epimerase family protein [Mucilaginibacter sp. Bleaf8]MBS7564186.1 aldose 1-epimerase family protein [Mucilaginibacter sp. Bleaf8]